MERRRASGMKDPQRSRVYAWEEAVVAPRDPTAIPYKQAQMLVDGIWLAEQLLYPPRVAPMPRQARRTWATGSRTTIRLPQDPACLAHLDHHNQGAILLKGSEGSAQVVRLWHGAPRRFCPATIVPVLSPPPIASTPPSFSRLNTSGPSWMSRLPTATSGRLLSSSTS